MTSTRIILLACIIFCFPLGLVAMAQVWQLQPAYASDPIKAALTLFAAVNWAGGLAWGFYLRARWGDTLPLLGIGGLAVAVFYTAYYSGQPVPSIPIGSFVVPFGLAFGVLTAVFDLLVLERSLHCLGLVEKEQAAAPLAKLDAETALQRERNEGKRLANEGKRLANERRLTVRETHTRTISGTPVEAALLPAAPAQAVLPAPLYTCACGYHSDAEAAQRIQQRQLAGHKRGCRK